ncbi:NEQ506 [Nanoarchaeum equitans Kin4-M]|uniref:NEQ506 n=1 Tax=Nanoarchaeum equitans (strain Kin4-M) TaxID=228908 RepID=Q74M68_NANEQ|nr:NEQ506 [Nanoarchaeum equitans Kin4-M]
MRIRLPLYKPIKEVAEDYYNKAKKIKEKIERAKALLNEELKKEERKKKEIKKEWFMKYRFTFTESGFLVIGGKDANQNERIMKVYRKDGDLVFHADIHGAPFALMLLNNPNADSVEEVIEKYKITETDLMQAAGLSAVYSKAWQEGLASIDVFYVLGKQISKKAPSGEYLKHGSFMVYGKKHYIRVPLRLYIVEKEKVYAVPSIYNGDKYIELIPGDIKKEKIAKKIAELLNVSEDYIKSLLPSGYFRITKIKNI